MAPKNRVIIDTDPGVDDVIALLLAMSASPEELEVLLISVTYGNVELHNCLRNVMALFHVLEKEEAWRKSTGKAEFGALNAYKPVVAMGAEHPLEDDTLMADHFHGIDGLHGVHDEHPHLTPAQEWRALFKEANPSSQSTELPSYAKYFTPSKTVAHKEILRILREEPDNTVSIVVLGPMTNVALAASEDPETFLRAKELVVMGGAVHVPGNITPYGEFNTYADAVAAARVFALTSPTPASTMPPIPLDMSTLAPYPTRLSRRLKLTLFPLDITTPHELRRNAFTKEIEKHRTAGSPLAQWAGTFILRTFDKIDSIVGDGSEAGLSLHDPLCMWYMLKRDDPAWKATPKPEDIRIETSGQWTRGMHVVDRRQIAREEELEDPSITTNPEDPVDAVTFDKNLPGDHFGWLSAKKGNRITRMVESPGTELFPQDLMTRIFG
ncbi:inosine-uridine preferring nucleoside hydrolase [Coniochaeta sp. 2T2.1]|nr:inosine-uridine preferring nucleoside hydrolase [Coniochaeta sp. 2T2.1]